MKFCQSEIALREHACESACIILVRWSISVRDRFGARRERVTGDDIRAWCVLHLIENAEHPLSYLPAGTYICVL